MSGSIDKLIDVCQYYENMDQLTQGDMYLLVTDQLGCGDISKHDREAILWWLGEVEKFLQWRQDVVRDEVVNLRKKLERES